MVDIKDKYISRDIIDFKNIMKYVIENNYNKYMKTLPNKYYNIALLVPEGNIYYNEDNYIDAIAFLGKFNINIKYIIKYGGINYKFFPKYRIVNIKNLKEVSAKLDVVFMFNDLMSIHVSDYIRELGIKTVVLSDVGFEEKRYTDLLEHTMDLYEVYSWLEDDISKKTFIADIIGDYTNSYNDYLFAQEAQYMLAGYTPSEGDIAIDGGAYDGQTAKRFHLLGAKVYSFELDKNNFNKCREMAQKYGYVAENYGLGKEKGTIKYVAADTASNINEEFGNLIGNIIDIDTYIAENDIARIDYIKLDVEGAELDTLKGAAKTISMFKPKMAISVYHKPEDLWTIAHYIKSIRPDYQFMWRHYPVDLSEEYGSFDVYREVRKDLGLDNMAKAMWEKVLYCK